jgi:hypothetical protein
LGLSADARLGGLRLHRLKPRPHADDKLKLIRVSAFPQHAGAGRAETLPVREAEVGRKLTADLVAQTQTHFDIADARFDAEFLVSCTANSVSKRGCQIRRCVWYKSSEAVKRPDTLPLLLKKAPQEIEWVNLVRFRAREAYR